MTHCLPLPHISLKCVLMEPDVCVTQSALSLITADLSQHSSGLLATSHESHCSLQTMKMQTIICPCSSHHHQQTCIFASKIRSLFIFGSHVVCWEHSDTNSAVCESTNFPLMWLPYVTFNVCFLLYEGLCNMYNTDDPLFGCLFLNYSGGISFCL